MHSALLFVGLIAAAPPRAVPAGDARASSEVEAFRRSDPTGYLGALGRIRTRPDLVLVGDDLRRLGALHLADALRQVPGLSLSRDQRGRWRVAQRGLRGARRVAIYVDGARADDAWTERGPLEMPLDLIERVEVRRGPLLKRPGANLVVDVRTHRTGGEVRVYGGGHNTAGGGGHLTGRVAGFELSAGAGGWVTAGPEAQVLEDAFTPQGLVREDDALRVRGDAALVHLVARARGAVGPSDLELSLRAAGETRGPWLGYFDTVDQEGRASGLALQGRADWRWLIAQPLEVRAALDVRQGFGASDHQVAPAGLVVADRDADGEDEVFPEGIRARESLANTRAIVDAGFGLALGAGHELDGAGQVELSLVEDYRLEMNRDLVGVPQPLGLVDGLEPRAAAASRARARASLRDRWAATERLDLSLALSAEVITGDALDPLDHLGGTLAAAWRPAAGFELGGRVARGLVAPSLEEQHSEVALAHTDISTGGYLGDPAARAESRNAGELWARYTSSSLEARAGIFVEQTQRAIEYIDDNGNVESMTNRGDTLVAGAEAWGRARLGAGQVFAQMSWFRGAFLRDGCEIFAGCSLLTETPQLRADLGGQIPVGIGRLGAWVELGSERRNNARTDLERLRPFTIPAYAVLNLGFESEAWLGLRVFAQAQNLLDAAQVDDLPRPDRVPGLVPRGGVRVLAGISYGG